VPVAKHAGHHLPHLLERVRSRPCLTLRDGAQHCIEPDHPADQHNIGNRTGCQRKHGTGSKNAGQRRAHLRLNRGD
jgi:hypothetical protein